MGGPNAEIWRNLAGAPSTGRAAGMVVFPSASMVAAVLRLDSSNRPSYGLGLGLALGLGFGLGLG